MRDLAEYQSEDERWKEVHLLDVMAGLLDGVVYVVDVIPAIGDFTDIAPAVKFANPAGIDTTAFFFACCVVSHVIPVALHLALPVAILDVRNAGGGNEIRLKYKFYMEEERNEP